MLAKNRNTLLSILFISLSMLACNLPAAAPAVTEPPAEEETETPTPTFTGIPPVNETPTPTPVITESCVPSITANTVANVRSGPGQVYNVIGSIPQGGTAKVAGKNFDGTWWYIEFAGGNGGFAWISGSVTNATCIPETLASIAAPPTPVAPTPTPTNSPVPAAPTPTPTSGGIIIVPPILILPTPTPTFLIIFPILTIGP